jgi:hypothetical protein
MEFVDILKYCWKVNEKINEKINEILSLNCSSSTFDGKVKCTKFTRTKTNTIQLSEKIWCSAGWDSNLNTPCLKYRPCLASTWNSSCLCRYGLLQRIWSTHYGITSKNCSPFANFGLVTKVCWITEHHVMSPVSSLLALPSGATASAVAWSSGFMRMRYVRKTGGWRDFFVSNSKMKIKTECPDLMLYN